MLKVTYLKIYIYGLNYRLYAAAKICILFEILTIAAWTLACGPNIAWVPSSLIYWLCEDVLHTIRQHKYNLLPQIHMFRQMNLYLCQTLNHDSKFFKFIDSSHLIY